MRSLPLFAALLAMGVVYYGGRIRMYLSGRRPALSIEEINSSDVDAPEAAKVFLATTAAALSNCVPLGSFKAGFGGRVWQYWVLLDDRVTDRAVTLVSTIADLGSHLRVVRDVCFTTLFADGAEVTTSSAQANFPLCAERNCRTIIIPQMADAKLLGEIHEHIVAELHPGKECITPWRDDCISWLRTTAAEHDEKRIRRGFEYIDPRTGDRRTTFKVASLAAFVNAWPMGDLRRCWQEQRVRAVLNKLGLPREYARHAVLLVPKSEALAG